MVAICFAKTYIFMQSTGVFNGFEHAGHRRPGTLQQNYAKKTYKPGQLQSTTHRGLNSKPDTVSMSMLLPKQLHLHTGRILMAISFMIGIIYILALFVG